MQERIADLQERRDSALHAGSERAVERQHAKGKMLARERIDYLLDDGSFHELDMLARHRAHEAGLEDRPYTDGVITGWGTVEGRRVFVFSQDFTVFGGALGEVFAELSAKFQRLVDALNEVSEMSHRHSDRDVLRQYEIWLKTGSPRAREILLRLGVIPAPVAIERAPN